VWGAADWIGGNTGSVTLFLGESLLVRLATDTVNSGKRPLG
jgi:hypothetical protein